MTVQNSVKSKKKDERSAKKSGLQLWLVFAFIVGAIGFLATQFEDPTPLTVHFRRWQVDKEILRKAEDMGGQVYSYDPLVIYLPNFLNASEITYLAAMGYSAPPFL